jgi:hypothetical protein
VTTAARWKIGPDRSMSWKGSSIEQRPGESPSTIAFIEQMIA